MANGSSQGLFVVVAIVIFGIFVFISYLLFRDNMQPSLAKIFCDSFTITSKNTGFGKLGNCGGDSGVDSGNDSEINTDDLLETQGITGNIGFGGSGLASIKDKSNDLETDIEGNASFSVGIPGDEPFFVILNYIKDKNKVNPSDEYTIYSLNDLRQSYIQVWDLSSERELRKNEFKVLLNGKEIKVIEGEYGLAIDTSEFLNNLKFKGYSENPNLEFVKGDVESYRYKPIDTLTILTKNEKIEIPIYFYLCITEVMPS